MRGLKRVLAPVVVAAAFVGLGLPAGAEPVSGPSEGGVAVDGWSRPLRVPIPKGRIVVATTAISNRGHIAVAYLDFSVEGEVPGYVIVRSPRGVWGAPHRLNPPRTDILGADVAFDRAGNLTAFSAFAVGPEGCCDEPRTARLEVATKPAGRAWSAPLRTGKVADHRIVQLGLSVAPSGKAAISWWQTPRSDRDPEVKARLTVRVRTAADAPWGRARVLSSPVPRANRAVYDDVAVNDDGSGMAVWTVCPLERDDRFTCTMRRSTLRTSGRWTPPVRIARNGLVGSGEMESTPAGFIAITWVNARMRTVVDLRTPGGIWSRHIVPGAHFGLAVGPQGRVVLVQSIFNESSGRPHGLRVTWRSNRSDWTTTTLASGRAVVFPLAPAIDRAGRIFVPWRQLRDGRPSERGLMSTFSSAWDTTTLWDWGRNPELAAADVSRNGRAVAIATGTTVVMRVLRPT
jgi:hypothetical protein